MITVVVACLLCVCACACVRVRARLRGECPRVGLHAYARVYTGARPGLAHRILEPVEVLHRKIDDLPDLRVFGQCQGGG